MRQIDIDTVAASLGTAALMELLGEEAAELAQAAAKYARVIRGENPTPVTPQDAHERLREEMADVLLVARVLKAQGLEFESTIIGDVKLKRWLKRLGVDA